MLAVKGLLLNMLVLLVNVLLDFMRSNCRLKDKNPAIL